MMYSAVMQASLQDEIDNTHQDMTNYETLEEEIIK
jgi:hypothetical protein